MPLVLLSGDEHEFTCETRGSRPRALTTWWLDGHKITAGVSEIMREAGNVTFSTLLFAASPRDNGKRLLCKSANPALPKMTVEDERILRVHFAPMVNISLGGTFSQSGIKEGSDVYLECSIWANPWIFEIAWQFEDRPLVANLSAGIVITNQTLLLQNVRRDHRGRYRCHASNVVGHSYSNHLRLLVQFAPICKSSEPRIYGISATETVNVTCDVEADPQDISYRWSLNTTLQTIVLSNWSRGYPHGVFSYSPQSKAGYGILLCWGRNNIGSQREPCVIKIVPAGAPESPHDCLVTNQTLQSLTIECQPGYNGSLPQIFHMEIYNSVVEHMADNLTRLDKPRFHVIDLSPGTSYVLVIYASNIKGRSNSVALVASTLSTAERRTAQDDKLIFNPLIGVLIGVVTLFVIIGIAIVIVVFKSHISRGETRKDEAITESSIECDLPKKDLEDSPENGSNKGPDIIPLSIDPDVFFTGRVADEPLYGSKSEAPTSEYVHEKYTDTVL
ncbi:Cell adhesion molecule 1 like protein [Argiope bruennichi]|uniref:Cell adhesion molecule 1 like protein n=1 Tax=Argiope bruennichi TaxID=94029 RepID=A0A8T0FRP8_ARGBR|nr:Cell adhesion molecule 1 like protein [Argiope bruennichi]